MRLFVVVFLIALGAAMALAAEPMFPAVLQGWVAKTQGVLVKSAKHSVQGAAASVLTTPEWTVPTGLLTVQDVGPTNECPYAACSSGRLLTQAGGQLTLSVQTTPLAVAPDVDYLAVLGARDGHVYDSVTVRWSRSDLAGVDPAERSVTKRKETELRHNRRVELKAPYDDLAVPPFIEDYNQAFDRVAKAHQATETREMVIDPLAAPMIGALIPGYFDPLDQDASEFGQSEIEDIVNQHFTLELVEARVFSARSTDDRGVEPPS